MECTWGKGAAGDGGPFQWSESLATLAQIAALAKVFAAAMDSSCLFPQAQACEVMVETTWLTSELGVKDNNLFGMKQHAHPIYGTVNLPTREFLHGGWVMQNDDFVVYPTMAACFADRMNTLETLAPIYPHYAAALKAGTPEEFLMQVSQTWSTGPARAFECIAILHAHEDVLS
jgi:flagellum-specific peptidoglycan hydrolase FlgJ